MPEPDPLIGPSLLRSRALSRWETELEEISGGPDEGHPGLPELTNAELVELRVRVIAVENLLITILAEDSERQLKAARGAADYIMPRGGVAEHPLTVRAAEQIRRLVDRADHFRSIQA